MKKPSKEKSAKVVPGMAATVTVVCVVNEYGTASSQSTVVSLNHAVVVQSANPIAAVGEESMGAKLRPLIVAMAPPLVGAFSLLGRFCETTGAAIYRAWPHALVGACVRVSVDLDILDQIEQVISRRNRHGPLTPSLEWVAPPLEWVAPPPG